MLRNILGQIFDSTLARFLTQPFFSHFWPFFSFSKYAETPYFYRAFSKNRIFVAHPPKLETLFANTAALTELLVLFSAFLFFGGFCCVRYLGLFLKGMKNKIGHKTTKKERRPEDANKKPHTLVYKKKESRQHRHKTMQLHCLDCKQTTQ